MTYRETFLSNRSKDPKLFVSYWPPVFLCASLIVYLSTAAPPVVTSMLFSVPYGDKIGHSVAYAMLTFLCAGAFRFNTGQWAARYAFVLALGTAFGLGVICEWYQFYLPFRSLDQWDILANMVGSCIAIVLGAGPLVGQATQTS